jgi:hypothetical protein
VVDFIIEHGANILDGFKNEITNTLKLTTHTHTHTHTQTGIYTVHSGLTE